MRQVTCKKILLGISHDNGYAPFLSDVLDRDASRQRISVIEATPTVKGIHLAGVAVDKTFTDLFMKSKISSQNSPSLQQQQQQHQPANGGNPSPPPSRHQERTLTPTTEAGSPMRTFTQIFSNQGSPSLSRAQNNEVAQWAAARRIDPPIEYDSELVKSIRARDLCDNYHLKTAGCTWGENCTKKHVDNMTPLEINTLRHFCRQRMCKDKFACKDEECTFGHHVGDVVGWGLDDRERERERECC
jgi:hypothetical protein